MRASASGPAGTSDRLHRAAARQLGGRQTPGSAANLCLGQARGSDADIQFAGALESGAERAMPAARGRIFEAPRKRPRRIDTGRRFREYLEIANEG
jgi:hypothetical protein